MLHGIYIGPLEHLKGKGALLIDRDTFFLAQFDDITATISGEWYKVWRDESHKSEIPSLDALGYGWHKFVKEHWSVDP